MNAVTRKPRSRKVIQIPQLKEFIDRPYVLDRSENYEEFLREIGVRKSTRIRAMKSKPTVILSQDKDEYVLGTSYPEGRHIRVRFKPEVEMKRRRSILHPTNSVFHVLDNKLIEEQQIDDLKILIVREFKKKDLLVTMEVNDVKCYRMYALEEGSMQSIRTETSRRSFLWDTESEVQFTSSSETISEAEGYFEEETEREERECY